MRVTDHQLSLLQRRELGTRRGAQDGVTRSCQLVRVHSPEERRARVSDNAPMYLRPELLGAEEHQTEIPSPLGDVEQHFANVSVGTI